ncbi:GTPase HflX [Reyranella sp.]|uniref:GTPase HflX n=1 Tax=Reyranella sp. TaxID=1929291 RepID=UPI00378439C6
MDEVQGKEHHDGQRRKAVDTARPATVAAVVCPVASGGRGEERDREARVAEAVGLARAIDLDVRLAEAVPLRRRTPATLLGKGAVERLQEAVESESIGLVIVDDRLTPVQQRNLEKAWQTKVIDRTGLILEIFGARARTHEGRLQVELAALDYQRGRLVRSWTHLERQRGGFGFLGGPGESQIEIDRRLIGERIVRIKRDLEGVRRTRSVNRAGRRKARLPTVALVGYTNAGKSTLFNRLSGAEVMAKDLLFATLDPTMRAIKLPNGLGCVISDTVGFVSDLPTHLVAAFRATLEEVIEADLIVHVRDISHPDSERQRLDVEAVLRELGVSEEGGIGSAVRPLIEALNKIDALPEEAREALRVRCATGAERARQYPVSAVSGEGVDALLEAVEDYLGRASETREVAVPLSDGATIAWLYRHGEVRSRHDDGELARLTVALDPAAAAQLERRLVEHRPVKH